MDISCDKYLSPTEIHAVEDWVYSTNSICPFETDNYKFNVNKNGDILTIYPHHRDGYYLLRQTILSPDSPSYQTIIDVNHLKDHEVLVLIVSPVYDSSDVDSDIHGEYSDHHYHHILI